jgi:hypothetical protein
MNLFDKLHHIYPHRGKVLLTIMSQKPPTPLPPDTFYILDDDLINLLSDDSDPLISD